MNNDKQNEIDKFFDSRLKSLVKDLHEMSFNLPRTIERAEDCIEWLDSNLSDWKYSEFFDREEAKNLGFWIVKFHKKSKELLDHIDLKKSKLSGFVYEKASTKDLVEKTLQILKEKGFVFEFACFEDMEKVVEDPVNCWENVVGIRIECYTWDCGSMEWESDTAYNLEEFNTVLSEFFTDSSAEILRVSRINESVCGKDELLVRWVQDTDKYIWSLKETVDNEH